MNKLVFLITLLFTTKVFSYAGELIYPSENAVVNGDEINISIEGCPKTSKYSNLVVKFNNARIKPSYIQSHYKNRLSFNVDLPYKSIHFLEYSLMCGTSANHFKTVAIDNRGYDFLEMGIKVANDFVQNHKSSSLEWNWKEGVFLYGLYQFADHLEQSALGDPKAYFDYISNYQQYHAKKKLKINWADKCTSALSGFEMMKDRRDSSGQKNLEKVIQYIKTEKRNEVGSLDHLGNETFNGKFIPFIKDSIWLDSLMMWGVLSLKYSHHVNDQALFNWSLEQPLIFSKYLQNPKSGLFVHAYNTKRKKLIPNKEFYWLRGNSWIAVSLVDMMETIGENHPYFSKYKTILENQIKGLVPYQMENGLWDNIANRPGFMYEDSAGNVLFSYAILKATRLGYLDQKYRSMGERAFFGVTSLLQKRDKKDTFFTTSSSGSTIPGPKFLYEIIKKTKNEPYAEGAYLLAALEMEKGK